MHQRSVRARLLLGLVALFVVAPAMVATADEEPAPTLQIRFPQETEVTVFSSTFGAPRPGGRRHTGNDLMAPKMTGVYAVADGVITVVGASSSAGRYLEIDYGNGLETRYLHLNNDTLGSDDGKAPWSLTVVPPLGEGSRVEAGELIAWVGDSGNAEGTGSHTHFEIVYQGRVVDPYPILRQAYRQDRQRAAELREEQERWWGAGPAPL